MADSDSRCAQGSRSAVCLEGLPRPAIRRDTDRIAGRVGRISSTVQLEPRAGPARRQGGPDRRADHLLPAGGTRPGFFVVQDQRRPRKRDRPTPEGTAQYARLIATSVGAMPCARCPPRRWRASSTTPRRLPAMPGTQHANPAGERLMQEAEHFAATAGSPLIERAHVEAALQAHEQRNDRHPRALPGRNPGAASCWSIRRAACWPDQRAGGRHSRREHLRPSRAHHGDGAHGRRRDHRHRARGRTWRTDTLQGCPILSSFLAARLAGDDAAAARQPGLRAIPWRRRGRQRLAGRTRRAALALSGIPIRQSRAVSAWSISSASSSRSAGSTRKSRASSTFACRPRSDRGAGRHSAANVSSPDAARSGGVRRSGRALPVWRSTTSTRRWNC